MGGLYLPSSMAQFWFRCWCLSFLREFASNGLRLDDFVFVLFLVVIFVFLFASLSFFDEQTISSKPSSESAD